MSEIKVLSISIDNPTVFEQSCDFRSKYLKSQYKDSGFDLHTPSETVCKAHSITMVPLGVKVEARGEMNETSRPLALWLCPRSSISKTPLMMANGLGVIDSGYRGEVKAAVWNHSDEDYTIQTGQRLFQLCNGDLSPFDEIIIIGKDVTVTSSIKYGVELSKTERGEGGFGSTGK